MEHLKRFFFSRECAFAMEYALIAGLVTLVAVAGMRLMGDVGGTPVVITVPQTPPVV